MQPAWEYQATQAPRPAWASPHFIMVDRIGFDTAPALVVAGDLVMFGSSADDTVRALDARTGAEKWRFITGGPVRFAPQIAGDRVYFGSDDGRIYCLESATGKPVWSFNAAPSPDEMIGNGRVISRWPIRTGVLVDEGVVYGVAGMWASEGIFCYALDAATGKVIWCNDNTGYAGLNFNPLLNETNVEFMVSGVHEGDFGTYGLTPQGALAAGKDVLLVPNGYALPAGLDRKTGRLLYAAPAAGMGGVWLCVDGNKWYTTSYHRSGLLGVYYFDLVTGKRLDFLRADGRQGSVPQLSITPPGKSARHLHDGGRVSLVVRNKTAYGRRAFGLVLAGDRLAQGIENAVIVTEMKDDRELWRAPVEGDAYELAVAGGRLYVSTSRGMIYAFEPAFAEASAVAPGAMADETAGKSEGNDQKASVIRGQLSVEGTKKQASDKDSLVTDNRSPITRLLRAAGMDRGYALVLGDAGGAVAESLVVETDLKVETLVVSEAEMQALRTRWLSTTAQYGTRLHAETLTRADRLPQPTYMANAIVVAGLHTGLSGRELARVLRPSGGVLVVSGLPAAEAETLVKEVCAALAVAGSTGDVARAAGDLRLVVRGRLTGTLDWDSNIADTRVKWPLRLTWFGGPTTAQVTDFRNGNERPFAAAGRYFTLGEDTLTVVDAYNGTLLWTRPIPKQNPDSRMTDGRVFWTDKPYAETKGTLARNVRINAEHVLFSLGSGYFRNQGSGLVACVRLDARTGEQLDLYGPAIPSPKVSLATPPCWTVSVDEAHSGTVTLRREAEGLALDLATRDPVVTRADEWDVFLDFRPPERRYGLYGRGTFHVRVCPAGDDKTPALWTSGAGELPGGLAATGKRTPEGTTMHVTLPWKALATLAGSPVESFGFALTLNDHDGESEKPIRRRHLFGDLAAEGVNNGWATVLLSGEATGEMPAPTNVVAGAYKALPKERAMGAWTRELDPAIRKLPRLHPLTGELGPRVFRTGTGACGGFDFSAASIYKRSGYSKVLGIYDFLDDSGLRSFNGASEACGPSSVAAMGVLINSEAKARCVCNYPFRTSLVLAPTDHRLNEDWAVFVDMPVDTRVRQAAVNLGAFGDRRDSNGTLWLGFPRPSDENEAFGYIAMPGVWDQAIMPGLWPLARSASLQVPMTVGCVTGMGLYRFNTDRIPVAGTGRPWLYGSGHRGIQRLDLQLDLFPRFASRAAGKPVTVDARLDDPAWTAVSNTVFLPYTDAAVWLAHDDAALYVAVRHPPLVDRKGATVPWRADGHGTDFDVWTQDSVEVFLGREDSSRVIHLGVSAGGATYDALASPAGSPDSPEGRGSDAGRDANAEDKAWGGAGLWSQAVAADTNGLVVELAIPWTTLSAAGIEKTSLAVNVLVNQSDVNTAPNPKTGRRVIGEGIVSLGWKGRERGAHLVPLGLGTPKPAAERPFIVRLHFAEPEADAKPGQRVFDVKLQGQTVVKGLDVVKEAGGARKALVKEFKGVKAGESLAVEFVPAAAGSLTEANAPILCALEVQEEGFVPEKVELRQEKAADDPAKGADGKAVSKKEDKPKGKSNAKDKANGQ